MEVFTNSDYTLTGFSLADRAPAFADFEARALGTAVIDARKNLKMVNELAAKLDKEDDCQYADVQIVKAYFQKLTAIAERDADKDLFRDINRDALNYYQMHPYLSSSHLFEVCMMAGISLAPVTKT